MPITYSRARSKFRARIQLSDQLTNHNWIPSAKLPNISRSSGATPIPIPDDALEGQKGHWLGTVARKFAGDPYTSYTYLIYKMLWPTTRRWREHVDIVDAFQVDPLDVESAMIRAR
jgi:hypothetical protein